MTLKTAAEAPIPMPSARTAATENPGARSSERRSRIGPSLKPLVGPVDAMANGGGILRGRSRHAVLLCVNTERGTTMAPGLSPRRIMLLAAPQKGTAGERKEPAASDSRAGSFIPTLGGWRIGGLPIGRLTWVGQTA